MKTYTKDLSVQGVKRALRKFYRQGRALNYVYETVNYAVQYNLINVSNYCPSEPDGGYFSFKYKGNKVFECSTTYPELLVA